jgi:glutathione synthase/RimK-type ligase-like ATP-grasp enzyme
MDQVESTQEQGQGQGQEQAQPAEKRELRLVDVVVTDENTALNLMVNFLTLAHKRGAFGIDESAKIWECIRTFQK